MKTWRMHKNKQRKTHQNKSMQPVLIAPYPNFFFWPIILDPTLHFG